MYDAIVAEASQRYQVPVSWINAVIETESSWNPNAYRYESKIKDASYGLMQLLGRTAIGLGFKGDVYKDLYDPAVNIDLGTRDLAQLRNIHGDDFRRVYSAYNSGDPDLWETSKEVAAHVANAMGNLAKWGGDSSGGLIIVLLAAAVLFLFANRK
jgi:soluble lytic murein transglycosylase-like protein